MEREAQDAYTAEHLRETLAKDPRVGGLDLHVRVSGDTVVVSGTVPTTERREAVSEVLRDRLVGAEVRNEVSVTDTTEPADREPEAFG